MPVQTKVSVKTPSVPNFIQVGATYVSIGEIPEETLNDVADDWRRTLIAKARRIKKFKEQSPDK